MKKAAFLVELTCPVSSIRKRDRRSHPIFNISYPLAIHEAELHHRK
ncbi:hypothetical protein V7121_03410 [Neobacillus drentensis]